MADPSNLDWFKVASPVLSSVLGGGAKPLPNTAISSSGINSNSGLDGSAFTVATGNGKATSQIVPWYVYAIAGFALIMWIKHK